MHAQNPISMQNTFICIVFNGIKVYSDAAHAKKYFNLPSVLC